MAYRNDLDALAARQTALETEVRERQRELADARRLVEEIQERARLPVLANIRVAAPCSARWDAMTGDDRVRACGDCKKTVYNLSELTRDEAEALILEKQGRLCVRYFQRADGTILLKDCAVGVKRRRRRRVVAAGIAASLAGVAGAVATASHGQTLGQMRLDSERPYPVLGGISPDPAPVPAPPAVSREWSVTLGAMSPQDVVDRDDKPQRKPSRAHPAPAKKPHPRTGGNR